MRHFTIQWRHYTLELGPRTALMGIVNITPDSFSDGGRYFNPDAAVIQGERLAAAGADILDIGGESTRPGAEAVSAQEEMDRILPVIEILSSRVAAPISVDTNKAAVAQAAVAAGAAMINDISAIGMDPDMAVTAARCQVPLILMHIKGLPRTMQVNPVYDDLLGEIRSYLKRAVAKALAAGVKPEHLIIDPGIGFGKTLTHNLSVLKRLDTLADLDLPILVGPSRKTFIRKILSAGLSRELSPDSPEVEIGTQAAVAMAVMNGAHIVRVHNVANTKSMVKVLDAIRNAQ